MYPNLPYLFRPGLRVSQQRFTIKWHDGSTEKVSERRLKALLKPPPRVPDLRYLRSSKRESSYPSSEPRIGPLYQATLPAGPPSPPAVPPQPAAPACSSGQEDLPPQKRLCGEPPGAHSMESSGRLDLRTCQAVRILTRRSLCAREGKREESGHVGLGGRYETGLKWKCTQIC